MKKNFSTKWVASKQPRKQRKYLYNAPLHTRHKFLSANLSKELRKKYNKRNLPLRKGDEVLVMRGSFKKRRAKVSSINVKRGTVTLENIQRAKRDGTKVNVLFHPSNLQIQSLSLDDKERLKALQRKNITNVSSEKSEESSSKKEESEENTKKESPRKSLKKNKES